MTLVDDVKVACDRLAPRGWGALLSRVSGDALNICQASSRELAAELVKVLPQINRSGGFIDFAAGAEQAVAAGRPSHSLLYHALASPEVHPTASGEPSGDPEDYATLDELDTLENYIYSLRADRGDLDDTVVAVFAYQYRPARRTSHGIHADMAYSRTGIARVGTKPANYDPSRRSFWVAPRDGSDGIAVLPARYGIFLARRSKPGLAGSVQGGFSGQSNQEYIFPLHKLFSGEECLAGSLLTTDFLEYHRNEKLKKAHELPANEGGLPVPDGFNPSSYPFVRDSLNDGALVELEAVGASRLVKPVPSPTLVRTISQLNTKTNREERLYFEVAPRTGGIRNRENRFADSSFQIPSFLPGDRIAPEYAHMRHAIDPSGPVDQDYQDLNQLPDGDFENKLDGGNYFALHYTDDSCDGCVEAIVGGLPVARETLGAFSLVTAPDFLPLADQIEVEAHGGIRNVEPLSSGRLPVNPTLPRPSSPGQTDMFSRDDVTVTAVVGQRGAGPKAPLLGTRNRLVSFLPDGASNVFAPGWDTSRSRVSISDRQGSFLTSSGLGSPFPEDAKLCAALSSFWPAVAPDNARTFGNQNWANQVPMTDEELGFHLDHPRVLAREVESYNGWDGEYGPFFENVGGADYVNFVPIERSDYVNNSLAGLIQLGLTAEVQSEDLVARNEALERCISIDPGARLRNACLVVFRSVPSWPDAGFGAGELRGAGFVAEFATFSGGVEPGKALDRVRRRVARRNTYHVGENGIGVSLNGGAFRFSRVA